VFVWWRKRARHDGGRAAEAPAPVAAAPVRETRNPEQLAHAAAEAEAEGDCELAAELLKSAGMYVRATDLYRRAGNMQKVAELELLVMELHRLSAALPVMEAPGASFAEQREPASMSRRSSLPPARQSTMPPARRSSLPPRRAPGSLAPSAMRESQRPRPPGLTVPELMRMLGPSPVPDLSNIEIFYRIGLTHMAGGNLRSARQAFATVDEVSPGYREVTRYLIEIQNQLGDDDGADEEWVDSEEVTSLSPPRPHITRSPSGTIPTARARASAPPDDSVVPAVSGAPRARTTDVPGARVRASVEEVVVRSRRDNR
jgi:hypothetical protein